MSRKDGTEDMLSQLTEMDRKELEEFARDSELELKHIGIRQLLIEERVEQVIIAGKPKDQDPLLEVLKSKGGKGKFKSVLWTLMTEMLAYRRHLEELFGRFDRGEDLAPATDAELYSFLQYTVKQLGFLKHEAALLYLRLQERFTPGFEAGMEQIMEQEGDEHYQKYRRSRERDFTEKAPGGTDRLEQVMRANLDTGRYAEEHPFELSDEALIDHVLSFCKDDEEGGDA